MVIVISRIVRSERFSCKGCVAFEHVTRWNIDTLLTRTALSVNGAEIK